MNLPINFLFDYFEFLKDIIPPYNQELIDYFKNISDYYELVLLTNYFESSQRNRLKNMGINDFFKECYGESIIKPNKEVFIESCGNYFPCECIMIGDSLKHDILPAKEVGMKTIYVSDDKEYDGIKVSNIKEITRELIDKIN